jgi:transcriptional regulator with XRE-family HTH domain
MIKIGQILKARREELGYTLDAISVKTKVPKAKLNAIEEGNIAYFKDELTYVKFYVRYYFNALHLNYDDYKNLLNESLDDYTQTDTLKKIEERTEASQRVKTRASEISEIGKKASKAPSRKVKLKADVGFISMFVISILVVLALIYVFVTSIIPLLNQTPNNDKLIVLPDPIVHEDDPDIPDTPEDKILTVTTIDATHFTVTGYEDAQEITLIIAQPSTSSWLGSKIDGVKVTNPQTGFYPKDAVYTLIIPQVHDDMEVEVLIGWVYKQNITLNGIQIPIDASIKNGSKTYFYFTFRGTPQ